MLKEVSVKSITVCEAVPEYLRNVKLRNSAATFRFYEQYLRFVCEFIGDLNVWELSSRDIDKMLELKKLKSPKITNSTLNKYIIATSNVYKFVTGRKLDYKKLKESRVVKEKIPGQVIKHILGFLHERRYDKLMFRNYIFIRLLFDTGLRLTEILHLKVDNINLDKDFILVKKTKTGHERIVVITPPTKLLLRQFLLGTNHHYQYLFVNYKNGERLSDSSIHSMLASIKNTLQLDMNINPHAWRHTFATNFLQNGGDMRTLQLLMGHSNYATTEKYLHYDTDDIIEGYKKVLSNNKFNFDF